MRQKHQSWKNLKNYGALRLVIMLYRTVGWLTVIGGVLLLSVAAYFAIEVDARAAILGFYGICVLPSGVTLLATSELFEAIRDIARNTQKIAEEPRTAAAP